MNVLDSSALLCFLLDEPGAAQVEVLLREPTRCSAANWSEVAHKAHARGMNWTATRQALFAHEVGVEPVTIADAEDAAALWHKCPGLSLADRLCLATAQRLTAVAWTADRAWGASDLVRQLR